MVRNNDRVLTVTLQKLSVDWTREILYSLRLCVVLVLQSQTRFLSSEGYVGVFREGTCLAMPKTIYAPDSSSLKPGSGCTANISEVIAELEGAPTKSFKNVVVPEKSDNTSLILAVQPVTQK